MVTMRQILLVQLMLLVAVLEKTSGLKENRISLTSNLTSKSVKKSIQKLASSAFGCPGLDASDINITCSNPRLEKRFGKTLDCTNKVPLKTQVFFVNCPPGLALVEDYQIINCKFPGKWDNEMFTCDEIPTTTTLPPKTTKASNVTKATTKASNTTTTTKPTNTTTKSTNGTTPLAGVTTVAVGTKVSNTTTTAATKTVLGSAASAATTTTATTAAATATATATATSTAVPTPTAAATTTTAATTTATTAVPPPTTTAATTTTAAASTVAGGAPTTTVITGTTTAPLTTNAITASTPNPYAFPFGGSIYKVTNNRKGVLWDDAVAKCKADNAYLTVINSAEEVNHLKTIANETFLVGFEDKATSKVFVTSDGAPIPVLPSSMWAPGQPDDSWGNEKCVHYVFNGKPYPFTGLNDYPCDRNFNNVYVCEKAQ